MLMLSDLDRLSDMEDDDEESQEATSSEAKDSDEEEDADSDESRDSEEDSLTVPSGKRRKTSETSESRADRVEDDSEEEDNGSLFSGSTGTFPKDKATAATPPTPRIVLKSTDAIMACALPYAFTSSSSDCQVVQSDRLRDRVDRHAEGVLNDVAVRCNRAVQIGSTILAYDAIRSLNASPPRNRSNSGKLA